MLLVLARIAANPAQPPKQAFTAMGVGVNSWYAATRKLERLGLIASTRGPAARKVKSFHVTPEGENVLVKLDEIWAEVANSREGLEWELDARPPDLGSPRAGEILCRLVELAERRADFGELRRLAQLSARMKRPGESLLAKEVGFFLKGQPAKARSAGEGALAALRPEGNSRSLRKAIAVLAPSLEYLGFPAKAYAAFVEARTLAKRAGDRGGEVDAWMGVGILHARLEHFNDAFRDFQRALKIAQEAGLESKRAKILGNLAFTQGFLDEKEGLATADEALRAARKVGASIVVARTQLTRSLLLAVAGRREESRRALKEARGLLSEGGEEKGASHIDDWSGLIKRILRSHHAPSPIDWRGQALRLAKVQSQAQLEAPQE